MLRRACVAGQFYPGGAKELQEEVRGFIKEEAREKATALIAPHAGYIYSGSVAGAVYSAVDIPDDVVLLGPNHTGLGARASVMTEGEWEIPTGTVGINTELAGMIAGSTRLFSPDTSAHLNEHSLEVQLPFIHCLNRGARFVPITVMQADLDECIEMGNALATRSERDTLWQIGLFSNKTMLGSVLLTFALQMATIYVPFLQPIFKTEALTMSELALSLALSSVVFFAVEVEKYFKRRGI